MNSRSFRRGVSRVGEEGVKYGGPVWVVSKVLKRIVPPGVPSVRQNSPKLLAK
jgi:hypothetical protein